MSVLEPTIEVLTRSGRRINISPEAFNPEFHTKAVVVEATPLPKPKRVRVVAVTSDIPEEDLARMSSGALRELPEFEQVPPGSWRNKQDLIAAILKVRVDAAEPE